MSSVLITVDAQLFVENSTSVGVERVTRVEPRVISIVAGTDVGLQVISTTAGPIHSKLALASFEEMVSVVLVSIFWMGVFVFTPKHGGIRCRFDKWTGEGGF